MSVPGTARLEARIRRAWTRRPGPALRAAGALYGAAADARLLLQELGVIGMRASPIPVVSVGGLTVGGSGKTPVASEVASWLHAAGRRPAVVTRGYPDELATHRRLLPQVPAFGHPDRGRAVREAARRGAGSAVLDDGFAHRALARRLDLLLVDADALERTNRRRLPAGPFRHPAAAMALADALVVTRRSRRGEPARRIAERLSRDPAGRPVALCHLRPGATLPVNEAARAAERADPAIALCGIMKPRIFLEQARRRWPRLDGAHSFRDHRGPPASALDRLLRAAGRRGIVCTLKDAVRIGPAVGEATPLWYVADAVAWERGASEIRQIVLQRTGGRA